MKDKKAYEKIKRARTSLVLSHPFFASLALRLRVQEDYNCHTAWTDGKIFGYNPKFVNMLTNKKLEGMAAHIVMHPACNHHKRRQGRDHDTWNKACDYAINGILLDAGFTLPDGFLFDEKMSEKSAEAVYEALISESDGDQDEEETSEVGESKNKNEDSVQNDEKESESGHNNENKNKNGENENSDSMTDPGQSGEVRDEEIGTGETEDQETSWDDAVIQAAINARGIGKLPANLERFIQEKLQPKLGWKELLSWFVERSARSDYSWLTPNRRYLHQGLYFPSLKNSEINDVFIGLDTSGSITQIELDQFSAEISAIFDQYPATVHILHCDMKLQKTDFCDKGNLPIKIKPKGGGGTDYRPVFEHIEKRGYSPSCLIYLTDLECINYPAKEPLFPVLWIKTGDSRRIPPFGEVIHLQ